MVFSGSFFFSHFEHYLLNAFCFYSCQESQSQTSPKHPPSSNASALASSEDTPAGERPAKSPSVESSGESQFACDECWTGALH